MSQPSTASIQDDATGVIVTRALGPRTAALSDPCVGPPPFAVREERVTAPRRIHAITRRIGSSGATGRVPARSGLLELEAREALEAAPGAILWSSLCMLPYGPISIEVMVQGAAFVLDVPRTWVDGRGDVVTDVPLSVRCIGPRALDRLPVPEGYTLCFPNPHARRLRVERVLRDVSRDGMSFYTSPVQDLALYPGLELGAAIVKRDGDAVCDVSGLIRHITPDPWEGAEVCGLQVFLGEGASGAWLDLLASLQE